MREVLLKGTISTLPYQMALFSWGKSTQNVTVGPSG